MTDGGSGYGTGSLTNYSYHDHPDDTDGWNEFTKATHPDKGGHIVPPSSETCTWRYRLSYSCCTFCTGNHSKQPHSCCNRPDQYGLGPAGTIPLSTGCRKLHANPAGCPYWQTEVNPADGITFLPIQILPVMWSSAHRAV